MANEILIGKMEMKLLDEFMQADDTLKQAAIELGKFAEGSNSEDYIKAGNAFIDAHKAMQHAAVVFSSSVQDRVKYLEMSKEKKEV